MRTAALTLIFVACACAANSQRFTLLPQVGFENSKTSVSYNGSEFYVPTGIKFSPHASLRLNYASPKGHGFFVGASSSRSQVTYNYANPELGQAIYTANHENIQVSLEGGYLFNSKPLSLGKASKSASSKENASKGSKCGSYSKSSCASKSYNRCGSSKATKEKEKVSSRNNSWVRIQPSIGMGFKPVTDQELVPVVKNNQVVYDYKAGNWNTALLTGVGFEFGRGKNRLFTVSANYVKGIGNMGEQSLTTESGGKTTTTTLQSRASSWNLRVGIPFTLKKASPAKKKSGCHQYKIQYNNRCRSIRSI